MQGLRVRSLRSMVPLRSTQLKLLLKFADFLLQVEVLAQRRQAVQFPACAVLVALTQQQFGKAKSHHVGLGGLGHRPTLRFDGSLHLIAVCQDGGQGVQVGGGGTRLDRTFRQLEGARAFQFMEQPGGVVGGRRVARKLVQDLEVKLQGLFAATGRQEVIRHRANEAGVLGTLGDVLADESLRFSHTTG